MTADTTRREHSGSGIRLGIGSCPGIAKILPAGIRGITLCVLSSWSRPFRRFF